MKNLPHCLLYAGVLGHQWVATRLDGDGHEVLFCQVSYGADAVRMLDETPSAKGGHIYERTGTKRSAFKWPKWARRSRAVALLDQAPGRPYEPNMADDNG